jgi:hypothetical protein
VEPYRSPDFSAEGPLVSCGKSLELGSLVAEEAESDLGVESSARCSHDESVRQDGHHVAQLVEIDGI